MTPEQWELVEEVFEDALEVDATFRRRLVAERCGDDSEVRNEVLRLLDIGNEPASFLQPGQRRGPPSDGNRSTLPSDAGPSGGTRDTRDENLDLAEGVEPEGNAVRSRWQPVRLACIGGAVAAAVLLGVLVRERVRESLPTPNETDRNACLTSDEQAEEMFGTFAILREDVGHPVAFVWSRQDGESWLLFRPGTEAGWVFAGSNSPIGTIRIDYRGSTDHGSMSGFTRWCATQYPTSMAVDDEEDFHVPVGGVGISGAGVDGP